MVFRDIMYMHTLNQKSVTDKEPRTRIFWRSQKLRFKLCLFV